jgi:UrcA family protein
MNTINNGTRRNKVRSALLTSLPAIFLALTVISAHAADVATGVTPPATTVKFGDLNLSNPEGVQHLYGRISGAAQEVCSTRGDRSLVAAALERMCVRQSIARAVRAVDSPQLTAFHAARTGQVVTQVAALTPK